MESAPLLPPLPQPLLLLLLLAPRRHCCGALAGMADAAQLELAQLQLPRASATPLPAHWSWCVQWKLLFIEAGRQFGQGRGDERRLAAAAASKQTRGCGGL